MLDGWAHKLGGLSHRPTPDETGWDRLLQFPQDVSEARLDRAPPLLNCFFQVKSSRSEKPRARLKLSAIKHLCDLAEPAFVALFQMGSGLDPERAWLIPIDEELMRKVLKRHRELSVNSGPRPPHKKWITIAGSRDRLLSPPYPESMRAAIDAHVGPDIESYRDRKAKWRRTLGYEDGNIEFTVLARYSSVKEANEALIDTLLGLGRFDFISSQQFDPRFGIRMKSERFPTGPGWLEVRPESQGMQRVRFFVEGESELDIILDGELATPRGIRNLILSGQLAEHDALKGRISIPALDRTFLDIVVHLSRRQLSIFLRGEYFQAEPRTLEEWFRFGDLLAILSSNRPVSVEIHGDAGSSGSGASLPALEDSGQAILMSQVIGILRRFVGKVGVKAPIRASWQEVFGAGEALMKMRNVEDNPDILHVGISADVKADYHKGLAGVFTLQFGDFTIYRPVAFRGKLIDAPPNLPKEPSHLFSVEATFVGEAEYIRTSQFTDELISAELTKYAELVQGPSQFAWLIMLAPLVSADLENS